MLSWLLGTERAFICAFPTLTPRVTGQHISVRRRRERLEQRADILEIGSTRHYVWLRGQAVPSSHFTQDSGWGSRGLEMWFGVRRAVI